MTDRTAISGVKNLIAVASGKGGVGKTTVAVNLAIALQRMGASVGLLDADVYGPNVPVMLGTTDRPASESERVILPVESYGLKVISMGLPQSRRQAVHLARADAAQHHPTISARREVGLRRLPDCGSAAGDRRRAIDSHAKRHSKWRGGRDDALDGGTGRRAQGH